MGALGGVLDALERSWGHLEWNLEPLGDALGPYWVVLGGSWAVLGRSWMLSGTILEAFFDDFRIS